MGYFEKFSRGCLYDIEDKSKSHECFKNWKSSVGSSTMEAAIIVNGFKENERMYGIRYHKSIADGDSSVYQQILETRLYKNRTVEKIENHLLRNFCKKMRETRRRG